MTSISPCVCAASRCSASASCRTTLVVVHRQNLAQNGQIVVALLGDEATVKTLKRKGSEVWLMPANPDYQPIDGRECTILGRVVAVVRQY